MTRRYENADALRRALMDRLRTQSLASGQPVNTLLTKVMMERLLARLFEDERGPWLLKGGYAFELRYRPNARTTRDLDLSVLGAREESAKAKLEAVHVALASAAALDLGDFMRFEISVARRELTAAPFGGATFPVQARLGDKPLGQFHVDVAFSEGSLGQVEELIGADVLGFAGLPPARVRAISKAQQFAEKLHAYTFPWAGRENTRVKDLVDMVMLIERETIDPNELRRAATAVFAARDRQALPAQLASPPAAWRERYPDLASQARVGARDVDAAFALLAAYWASVIG